MSEKIRFAVVGSGHIGKRHAAIIGQNPDSELVAMIDTNSALASAIEAEFKVPFFDSLEKFLSSGLESDVLNVCTPNGFHAPQAIAALEAGKHVVVEKPMALSKADCEEIIYKSIQTGKLVFCVMQNRYSPPAVWLKEVVNSKRLGQIHHVQINCFWNRDARYYKAGGWKGSKNMDGGPLFTQFSHFIDVMFWLFGDISNIQARFYDFNHKDLTEFEDSVMANFEFTRGGTGSFNCSTSVYDTNLESSMTIIAGKGSIKIGGQYMNKVEYCHIEGYQMPELAPGLPANDYGFYKGSAANHHFVIENVVNTLKGKTVATTNALEGMKVVEIIEKIYALK